MKTSARNQFAGTVHTVRVRLSARNQLVGRFKASSVIVGVVA
jgi:molybdopterin-binding protein